MNTFLKLISDADGAPSTMRVCVLLIVGAFTFVWSWLSIHAGQFVTPPAGMISLIIGALGSKAAQSFAENLVGQSVPAAGSASVPAGLPPPTPRNGSVDLPFLIAIVIMWAAIVLFLIVVMANAADAAPMPSDPHLHASRASACVRVNRKS